MSFQDSVSFECGSKFLRLYDCTQRQARLQQQATPAGKAKATTEDAVPDPCERPRREMQLCMLDIYVESVCYKQLQEVVVCTKEAGKSAPAGACGSEHQLFAACVDSAMEGSKADQAFQLFTEQGRTWRSPTKGRHSLHTM